MHLPERTGQQTPVLVGHVDLGQQSPRGRINGFRRARHLAEKLLAGKFLQSDGGLGANLYERRVGLRNAGVNPQRIDARNVKQFAARGASASVDQRAGIDVAAW